MMLDDFWFSEIERFQWLWRPNDRSQRRPNIAEILWFIIIALPK